jgi:hypothetical protein
MRCPFHAYGRRNVKLGIVEQSQFNPLAESANVGLSSPEKCCTFLEILFRSRFTARSFDDYSDDVADRRISQNMRAQKSAIVLSYSRTWPQVPAHILPVVRVGGIPNDASYPLVRSYSRVQPLALLGENKVPMVRVEHQFSWPVVGVPLAQRFVDQFHDTASRFVGRCEDNTDWIGLCWASLRLPTGTDGVSSQWQRVEATPL